VGFEDICSEQTIEHNISNATSFCATHSKCRKYFESGFSVDKPEEPCWESALFKKWVFGADNVYKADAKGVPKAIKSAEKGNLAVLTTVFPGENEKERRVIGVFQITDVDQENISWVAGSRADCHVRLKMADARRIFFWDYFLCDDALDDPKWGIQNYKYMTDEETIHLLSDMASIVDDASCLESINALLKSLDAALENASPHPSPNKEIEKRTKKPSKKQRSPSPGYVNEELENWLKEDVTEDKCKSVDDLIVHLHNQDAVERKAAALELSRMGESALEVLSDTLISDNQIAAKAAAWALSEIGEPTIGILIDALENGEEYTRKAAALALAKIGTESNDALVACIWKTDNPFVLKWAGWSLWKINDAR